MDYAQFREALIGTEVAEGDLFADDPAMVSELDWQSRWFAGEFGREFTAVDGERIEIREFGWWNRGAGPDFVDVVASVNGEIRRGALELDIDARDWEKHGHATNPLYESVLVHLFFRAPTKRFFSRGPDNRQVPQVLLPVLPGGAGRRDAALRLGRCSEWLGQRSDAEVKRFLLGAARLRANEKARRFLRVAGVHGVDEAWYLACAEALGYYANREPMRVLAQRLPWRLLRTQPAVAEALLFGHAGFLEAKPFDDATEPRARQYLRRLWEDWWKFRGETVRHLPWSYVGQRPTNHPQRRVATLALVLANWPLFRACVDADHGIVDGVTAFFENLQHPFWSHHFTLTAEPRIASVALVGRERALDFLGNTVLPVRAHSEPSFWPIYETLPAGQANRSVTRAAERLLGRRSDLRQFLQSFALQQGLLQVYRDFCLADTSACRDCVFPEQLRAWSNQHT